MKKHFFNLFAVLFIGLITVLTGCDLAGGSKKSNDFEPGWYKLTVEVQGIEEVYYFQYDENGYLVRAGTKTREWDTEITELEKSYGFEVIAEELELCPEKELPIWALTEKSDGTTLAKRINNILKNPSYSCKEGHYPVLYKHIYDEENDSLLLRFNFGSRGKTTDEEKSMFPGIFTWDEVKEDGFKPDNQLKKIVVEEKGEYYQDYLCFNIRIIKNSIEYKLGKKEQVTPYNYFLKNIIIKEIKENTLKITFINNDYELTYEPFVGTELVFDD